MKGINITKMQTRLKLRLLLPTGIILLLIWACAGIEKKKPLPSDVHVFDTDKVALQDGFKYSDLFDSVKVIPLDNASFLLASIHRFKACPDGLVVWDSWQSQGVALFDRDGNFIRRIGSRGMGPEEYRNCDDVAIDARKQQVYVLDNAGRAVHIYRLSDGRLVRSLPLPENLRVGKIGCEGGNLYLLKTHFFMNKMYPENFAGQDYILYRMDDASGEVTDRWFPYQTHNKGWLDSANTIENFYRLDDEHALFAYGVMDTLMCMARDEVYPCLALSGNRLVTKQDVASILEQIDVLNVRERMEAGGKLTSLGLKEGKVVGITTAFGHGKRLYFTYLKGSLLFAVYSLETGDCASYMHVADDVFFTSDRPIGFTLFSFLGSDEGGVYYAVPSEYLGELTYYVEHGLVSDKVCNAEALRKLDADSNPVILYYEFKEE